MHFVLEGLKDGEMLDQVECLAKNTQNLRTLNVGNWAILDSYAFLSAPLDKLVENLTTDAGQEFKILKNSGIYETMEQKELLLRKG